MSARIYERKFDWDEARRLRAAGLSYSEIGRRLGVTHRAVMRVANDGRGRLGSSARDGELWCYRCEQWKPDGSFYRDADSTAVRRQRSRECRPCSNTMRQEHRERHKVPCRSCGAPCLPASEKGTRGQNTGLCRKCWLELHWPKVATGGRANSRRSAPAEPPPEGASGV